MTTRITPRLGTTVLYTLTEADANQIRNDRLNLGRFAARGNECREGDTFPAIIVRDFISTREVLDKEFRRRPRMMPHSPEAFEKMIEHQVNEELERQATQGAPVNLRVLLDGNDVFWATSRTEFDPEKHGRWVQVIDGRDEELPPGYSATSKEAEILRAEGYEFGFRPDPKGRWTAVPVTW